MASTQRKEIRKLRELIILFIIIIIILRTDGGENGSCEQDTSDPKDNSLFPFIIVSLIILLAI